MRFTRDQQDIINDIIRRFIKRYDKELSSRYGWTEVEYEQLKSKHFFPSTLIRQRLTSAISTEETTMDEKLFMQFKEASLRQIVSDFRKDLPGILSRDYRRVSSPLS